MKLLFIFLFLLSFSNINAQRLDSLEEKTAQEWYHHHMEKKKILNTIAWVTVITGPVMILSGLIINAVAIWDAEGDGLFVNDTNKGLWLSYLGGAVSLASIPLFIISGKHKKKAELYLSQGAVGFNHAGHYTGLGISFSF
jgi:hypothetical protein